MKSPLASITVLAAAGALALALPAHGQSALGGSAGQSYSSPSPSFEGGGQVFAVSVILEGSTGDLARDDRIRQAAASAVGIQAGDSVDPGAPLLALQRLRAIDGVADAEYGAQTGPMGTSLVFRVKADGVSTKPVVALPKLHEDSTSMVKLILNGGLGLYSDGNAFFLNWDAFNKGSPIAPGPATGRRVTFSDISIEPGIGGIAEVGQKLYVYGSATVLASGTWGQGGDLPPAQRQHARRGREGVRWFVMGAGQGQGAERIAGAPELHAQRRLPDSPRQGLDQRRRPPRGLTWCAHRSRHDRVAQRPLRGLGDQGLLPRSDEYESLESNSKFAGGNVRYDVGNGLTIDGTYIENVHSDSSFATPQGTRVPREGISTTAAHLRWRNALDTPGLFIESEIGHQRSSRADVSASAGYASAGYRFKDARWSPALVVRYSQWSGDRPETARYERWDPLLPAGSDEWMGGMIFSKYVSNSNLQQLRLRFFAEPTQAFNFTVDWFKYQAMEANNLGANPVLSTLQSRDLGNELMFTGRWYVGKNHYVQTLASINWPGEAIRRALPEPTKPWTTLQATVYWFF